MIETILQNPLWQAQYFNNALWEYVLFFAIFAILSMSFFLVKILFLKRLSTKVRGKKLLGFLISVIDKIRSPFYIFVSFYIALQVLEVPALLFSAFTLLLLLWTLYRVVMIGYQSIDFVLDEYRKRNIQTGSKAMVRAVGNITKGFLWIFAGLIVLSFLGVNVNGLIAGMGIGGVAIAFALQGILSDLFSSFSIYLDKPFIEGDLISVGDKWGTIEKIGIKSTRMRSLQGEEIIFSNKELTSAQVHNRRNMIRRRAEFSLGITYETPSKKMEKIPKIVKKIVEKEEIATFDRIHFYNFGDFSLNYILVYYIETKDYMAFMDANEKILLNIKKAFEKEEIEFAYPTEKIYLSKSNS